MTVQHCPKAIENMICIETGISYASVAAGAAGVFEIDLASKALSISASVPMRS